MALRSFGSHIATLQSRGSGKGFGSNTPEAEDVGRRTEAVLSRTSGKEPTISSARHCASEIREYKDILHLSFHRLCGDVGTGERGALVKTHTLGDRELQQPFCAGIDRRPARSCERMRY